jgi:hypothetical protein
MLLMMSENVARNVYSSQEIINYPTLLQLVGNCFVYHRLHYLYILNQESGGVHCMKIT